MSGWAAAIEGVTGVAGGILAHESSKKLQKWEHLNNQSLMRDQFSNNVEMWNMQNAYNTPSEQMKRMRDAGLNPALMYGGKGGGMAGNAPNQPAAVKPLQTQGRNHTMSGINAAMSAIDAFQNIELKQAQTDNVNAQSAKNKADTTLIEQRELIAQQEHIQKKWQNTEYEGFFRNLPTTPYQFKFVQGGLKTEQEAQGLGQQNILRSPDVRSTRLYDSQNSEQWFQSTQYQKFQEKIQYEIQKTKNISLKNDLLNLQHKYYEVEKLVIPSVNAAGNLISNFMGKGFLTNMLKKSQGKITYK